MRVALGAARGDVLRLIVGQGLKLAGIGVVLGAIGAAMVTPLMRMFLYNVTPTDPFSFIAVAVFLMGIASVASFIPARRALLVGRHRRDQDRVVQVADGRDGTDGTDGTDGWPNRLFGGCTRRITSCPARAGTSCPSASDMR